MHGNLQLFHCIFYKNNGHGEQHYGPNSDLSKITEGRKFREKLSSRCQPDEIRSPSSPKDDEGGDTESVDSSD